MFGEEFEGRSEELEGRRAEVPSFSRELDRSGEGREGDAAELARGDEEREAEGADKDD
jgi:hypothetical protein